MQDEDGCRADQQRETDTRDLVDVPCSLRPTTATMSFQIDSHTHRRFNPLLNTFVMVAPHRTQRPWQGQQEKSDEKLPAYDPDCYLCPGNKRANGDMNPKYTSTFMFKNDYAAVKADQPELPFTQVDEKEVKNGGTDANWMS